MKATTDRCLKVARDLDARGEPITSQALVEAIKIKDTERSSALDIAAGWISTLRRYGLLKPAKGEKVPGPRRHLQVYRLTDWGRRYKQKKASERATKIAANPKGD